MKRRAILIASANFDPDSGIEPLPFPENDVAALEAVLQKDEFGFEQPISKVIDAANHQVLKRLEELMVKWEFGDFLLIYFSGHGKLNTRGELFFSCRNTDANLLDSTGLRWRQIQDMLDTHQNDRVAIILDCCYAGRAVSGLKGSVHEQVKSELDSGRGFYVLGACSATQLAEERELDGHGIFTGQIIEGLTTGAADVDRDGRISLPDLGKYVRDEFRKKKINQDPVEGGVNKSGDLILGTNRKTLHSKTVATFRLKIEEAKRQFNKGTYRTIEDYLDEVSARSDFDNIAREPRFLSLGEFVAGGKTEEIIDAFRQPSGSESGRQEEPQQAPPITEVPTPARPQRAESKPPAQQPSQPLVASGDRTPSSLPPASKPPTEGTVETQVETQVEAIAPLGQQAPPPIRRSPREEPDLEPTESSSVLQAVAPAVVQAVIPRHGYAGFLTIVVLSVGAFVGIGEWFGGSQRDAKTDSQIGPTITSPSIKVEDRKPTNAPPAYSALMSQGDAASKNGDFENAIARYGEAIRIDPKGTGAFLNRGIAYWNKGDNDRAISDFSEAIRLDPKSSVAFASRGIAYDSKGDNDRAIADYSEAIRLDPKLAPAFVGRGSVYRNKGDYDRAIADYSEAIRIDPKDALAFYRRGQVKLRIKDKSGNADIAKAKQLDPSIGSSDARH